MNTNTVLLIPTLFYQYIDINIILSIYWYKYYFANLLITPYFIYSYCYLWGGLRCCYCCCDMFINHIPQNTSRPTHLSSSNIYCYFMKFYNKMEAYKAIGGIERGITDERNVDLKYKIMIKWNEIQLESGLWSFIFREWIIVINIFQLFFPRVSIFGDFTPSYPTPCLSPIYQRQGMQQDIILNNLHHQ